MFETACAIPVERPRGAGSWACAAVLVLALALFSTGCLFQKKHQARVFIPPPVQRAKPIDAKLPPVLDPPDLAAVATVGSENAPVVIGAGITELPPPPPAPPRGPGRPPAVKPAATPPAPVEPLATPRIGQIFTQEQLRENNKILDEMLERVQTALDKFAKKNLTAEQRNRVAQIRDFQTQAKQARVEDLVTAVSLAKHADLLAKDLLDRLP
jgi:hypothetical protein